MKVLVVESSVDGGEGGAIIQQHLLKGLLTQDGSIAR